MEADTVNNAVAAIVSTLSSFMVGTLNQRPVIKYRWREIEYAMICDVLWRS